MDPEEDIHPTLVYFGGPRASHGSNRVPPMGGGGISSIITPSVLPPHINNNTSIHSNAPSDESTTARGVGSVHTAPSAMILRISLAQDGDAFGCIHLSSGEIINQAAIITYFDNAGREVEVLPCPDFEGFMAANLLRTHTISFLCDLPDYILQLGCQILDDTTYSSSN